MVNLTAALWSSYAEQPWLDEHPPQRWRVGIFDLPQRASQKEPQARYARLGLFAAGNQSRLLVRLLEPHLGEPRSPRELCRHTDWRLRRRGRHFCVYLADFFGVLVK